MKHMHPERVLEIEVFKAEHPEVDWTRNEVLLGFENPDDLDNRKLVPKSWWSYADRDKLYETMQAQGFRIFRDADGDWHANCPDECRTAQDPQ